jgi:bifunctional non-homologous end joining protein LigD
MAIKKATRKTAAKRATKTAAKSTTRLATKAAPAKKTATKSTAKNTKTPVRGTVKRRVASAAAQLKEYQRKRDFEKTAEPSGAGRKRSASGGKARSGATDRLGFVIQKHDASHLHYDLRLEMNGVMKSWAVPKGPSADPGVKRLAMQVEDHPIEYNSFEGTIPAGEYGGGTVMLWDNGTYEIENRPGEDQDAAALEEHESGELKIVFHGKRIKGSYALVRTHGFGSSSKPSWLLIKHRDEYAHPGSESALTEKHMKSVTTKRTMDQISKGTKVWHSSR